MSYLQEEADDARDPIAYPHHPTRPASGTRRLSLIVENEDAEQDAGRESVHAQVFI